MAHSTLLGQKLLLLSIDAEKLWPIDKSSIDGLPSQLDLSFNDYIQELDQQV
jgi:hypothetical protein